jgi:TfoX/Sxy family transcriptional regulator of competence genes
MHIGQVPRNDLTAAEAYYRAKGRHLTIDQWRLLWRLQDDPANFEELSRDWDVEEAPSPSYLDELLGG